MEFKGQSNDKNVWIADSGETHHVVNNTQVFTNNRESNENYKVEIGNRQTI